MVTTFTENAVMKWVYKIVLAVGAGAVGFFVLPMAWGALTGVLAALFDAAGAGVPVVLTMEFGTRLTVPLALLGFVGGAYLGVMKA